MERNELQRVAKKYINGTATTEEKEMLSRWFDTVHSDEQVEKVLTDAPEGEAQIKRQIFENVRKKIKSLKSDGKKSGRNRGIIKKIVFGLASTAAVIFIAAGVVRHFNRAEIKTYSARVELVNVIAKEIMKIN